MMMSEQKVDVLAVMASNVCDEPSSIERSAYAAVYRLIESATNVAAHDWTHIGGSSFTDMQALRRALANIGPQS
jgi:hypothetical protein